MTKINGEMKLELAARYAQGEPVCELARAFGVCEGTVYRALKGGVAHSAELTAHVEAQGPVICKLVDQYLQALGDPEKVKGASVNQLSSALNGLVDRFSKKSADAGGELAEAIERAWARRGVKRPPPVAEEGSVTPTEREVSQRT